jgi:leader peptidase (prepilin peptidase)/N-methyltransferase
MLVGRARRKSKIPFGPFMLAGAVIAILWGGTLWDGYMSVMT